MRHPADAALEALAADAAAHVEDCPGCARRLAELRSLRAVLRSSPVPPPAVDLGDRITRAAWEHLPAPPAGAPVAGDRPAGDARR